MNNKNTIDFRTLAAIVLLASSIIRAGACLYLPAMPSIADQLRISDSGMGLTISIYFVVFSACILVAGPLADAFGRKKVITAGLIIFGIGSALCGLAHSLSLLLAGRVVQAAGASMIPGTSRAIVRDAGDDMQVVSVMGWLAILSSIMLVGAPIAWGFITHYFQWRGNFVLLFTLAVILFLMTLIKMRETLPPEKRIKLSIRKTFGNYREMLMSRKYMFALAPVILCFVFQGIYLAIAPTLFIRSYGLSPIQFGLSNIIIVAALTTGRYISVATARRQASATGYRIAAGISLLSAAMFATAIALHLNNIYAAFITLGSFGIAFGTLLPIGMKESITIFRERGGMAAALQGSLLLGATAIGSIAASAVMKTFPEIQPFYIFAAATTIIAIMTAITAIPAASTLKH
jgi:DHA1 family bicyclomycin/chloramphenicol resistance-like MFS transporter